MEDRIYILYGGESEDGRGYGQYITYTDDWRTARDYYMAKLHNNPYATGYVAIMTKRSYRHATLEDFK